MFTVSKKTMIFSVSGRDGSCGGRSWRLSFVYHSRCVCRSMGLERKVQVEKERKIHPSKYIRVKLDRFLKEKWRILDFIWKTIRNVWPKREIVKESRVRR